MSQCKPRKTPTDAVTKLSAEDEEVLNNKPVRELISSLTSVALSTRPDISSGVNLCSRYQERPTNTLWNTLKGILHYIKGTVNLELFYTNQVDISTLVGYAVADWADDEMERKSTSGYGFKQFDTISWCFRRRSVTAMSSI